MAQGRPRTPIVAISGSLGPLSFRQKSTKAGLNPPEDLPENAYEPGGKGRMAVVQQKNRRPRAMTPARLTAAQQLAQTHRAWRELSDAQRAEWNDAASVLQLTQDEASVGQWSGREMFIANRRRFIQAGESGPDVPDYVDGVRIDRPWLKGWAGPTPGELHLFNDPITSPFPDVGSVGLVYASPPRSATRKGKARREVFRTTFDPNVFFTPADPIEVSVEPWPANGPGSVIDVRAVIAGSSGQTSALHLTQLQSPPAGHVLAFIVWTYTIFGYAQGIELGADRVLKVWSFDYPSGAPDTLDLLNPSPKTIGQVKAFMAARAGWDVHTIDASNDAAPAASIPCIKRHANGYKAQAIPFFSPE